MSNWQDQCANHAESSLLLCRTCCFFPGDGYYDCCQSTYAAMTRHVGWLKYEDVTNSGMGFVVILWLIWLELSGSVISVFFNLVWFLKHYVFSNTRVACIVYELWVLLCSCIVDTFLVPVEWRCTAFANLNGTTVHFCLQQLKASIQFCNFLCWLTTHPP